MAKKKFQIALNPCMHDVIKRFAEQNSTSIGSVVELAAMNFLQRVRTAYETGEVPKGIGPMAEVGRLLGYKDRGVLDKKTFDDEIENLRTFPGDKDWTKK